MLAAVSIKPVAKIVHIGSFFQQPPLNPAITAFLHTLPIHRTPFREWFGGNYHRIRPVNIAGRERSQGAASASMHYSVSVQK
jgi:hypothetical protein